MKMGDMHNDERVTYFAQTNFRGQHRRFGIRRKDRRHHMHIIGKTGVGKSTLLATMMRQDIENGEGLALLDPHGDLVEAVLAAVPEGRKSDVIYFNVADRHAPLGLNPLESVPPEKRSLVASGVLDVFKKLWGDSWGPRLEHLLRNALLALLDQPEATLADIPRFLEDKAFRKSAALRITNKPVYEFWMREFDGYTERLRVEAISPILNKVGAFVSNPLLHRILSQQKSSFDLRRIMDEGKILLVNLSKGKIGEDAANLMGSLLVSQLGLAAVSRAEISEDTRRDFFLYLDEFQNFSTMSFVTMLSELRKYRLDLVLAHQFFAQLSDPVRDAVLGNVGTMAAFRVGLADAEILEKEFRPEIGATDLVNLPNHHVYLKLMIDGQVSKPFSAETVIH